MADVGAATPAAAAQPARGSKRIKHNAPARATIPDVAGPGPVTQRTLLVRALPASQESAGALAALCAAFAVTQPALHTDDGTIAYPVMRAACDAGTYMFGSTACEWRVV